MSGRLLVVEADGGSRGNPGVAGYGAAVSDGDTVVATRRGALGTATNNVAEYRGLIAGLAAAAELADAASATVEVRMDSKLVVEQMTGRWRIKNAALAPLARVADGLTERFATVRYRWVPRAENERADRLANEAMDAYLAGELSAEPVEPAEATGGVDAPAAATTGNAATWSGASGDALRLVLLRHGQTEFSVQRRYSGHGDPELTEIGHRQAKAAADRLAGIPGITAVLSSPLRRAEQTARRVAEATGARLATEQRLVELDFGAWEGLTFAEAAERYPEQHRAWLADPTVATPNGESFADVHTRVLALRDELLERYAGQTLVLVSHVTPIKTMLRIGFDAGPSLLYRCHLDLAALSKVDFYPDGNASVTLVNDTSHLG